MMLRPHICAVLGSLFVGAGVLVAATSMGQAATRDVPPTGNVLEETPGHIGLGSEPGFARQASPQQLQRLAASKLPPPTVPPQPPKHTHQPPPPAAPQVKSLEAKSQKDAAKDQPKDAAPKGPEPKPLKEAAKEQPKGGPIAPTALAMPPFKAPQPNPQKETGKGQPKDEGKHQDKSAKDAELAPPAKLSPKEVEQKQQETSKQRLKEESAKLQEPPKHPSRDAGAKAEKAEKEAPAQPAKGSKPQEAPKVAESKHGQQQDGPKPHDKDTDAKHALKDAPKLHEKDEPKPHGKDTEPKLSQHDGAKQHDKDKDAKHEERLHGKDAEPKQSQHDGARQHDKDASKSHDKDADPKHHDDKQVLAKEHSKDSDPKHHGKQEEAKKAEREKAAKAKAAADAAAKAKADADAKVKAVADAAAAATAKAAADAAAKAKAAADAAAAAAKAKAVPLPTDAPVATKPASQDAPQPTDSKPSEAVVDPAAAQSTGSTQLASATNPTPFPDSVSKLGGPVQDNSADPLAKGAGLQQQAARPSDDRQTNRAKKADEKGGSRPRLGYGLPPPLDAYRQSELLIDKSSLKLLEELRRRGYPVGPSSGAGLLLVSLPPDGPNAWDVQRELEASFPDTRLGLNYVYRTYKPYRGASQPEMLPKGTARKGCSAELCYGPDVIHWNKSLAVCAAGLKVGMIDTSIDAAHPAFPPKGVKVFDLAHKHDAPPAVHWHGTGVLSLMAGVADSSTPGLIPGAAFSAANVFFTNKDGELETDTAHLTEALAAMKGEGVRVVNMSLVGPQDDLVHRRITDMATYDGVVFVAAAGNGGPDALPGYPAAYEEVIAVTAVDRNKASYDHANRGTYIDMAAPGVQILAALPGGKEGLLSGTSFAAPFVTAVVAVAYRDTGLEKAAKEGRGRLDPKGVMLSHLFRKDELQTRSPIKGYGLVRAPDKCGSGGGSDAWTSVVKPTPSVPTAATVVARPAAGSIALDSWQGQTIVQQASLPSEAAK